MTNENTDRLFVTVADYYAILRLDGDAWRWADFEGVSSAHHFSRSVDEVIPQVCPCGVNHDLEGDEEGLFWDRRYSAPFYHGQAWV